MVVNDEVDFMVEPKTIATFAHVTEWAVSRIVNNRYDNFNNIFYEILQPNKLVSLDTKLKTAQPYLEWGKKNFDIFFDTNDFERRLSHLTNLCTCLDCLIMDEYKTFYYFIKHLFNFLFLKLK